MPDVATVAPIVVLTVIPLGLGLVSCKTGSLVKDLPAIAGWVFLLFEYVYHRFDRVYLLVQRCRYWMLNIDSVWTLTVTMESDVDEETFDCVAQTVLGRPGLRALVKDPNHWVVQTPRLCFDLRLVEREFPDYVTRVHISVGNMTVSYRGSTRLLEKDIIPVLEDIERALPHVSRRYYGMTIHFQKANPYFGLFIKRLGSRDITQFDIGFKVENGLVTVNRDRVCVGSQSLLAFRGLASKYLTLSGTSET